jgi:hypothetical protein
MGYKSGISRREFIKDTILTAIFSPLVAKSYAESEFYRALSWDKPGTNGGFTQEEYKEEDFNNDAEKLYNTLSGMKKENFSRQFKIQLDGKGPEEEVIVWFQKTGEGKGEMEIYVTHITEEADRFHRKVDRISKEVSLSGEGGKIKVKKNELDKNEFGYMRYILEYVKENYKDKLPAN